MEKQVFLFDVEGQEALGFDTGLDSRAFARAKFAQFITEPGFIVNLDGSNPSVNFWKAEGVVEYSAMVVWGPPFKGDRLDLLLHDNNKRGQALTAIRRWIQAVFALGEKYPAPIGAPQAGAPPLWPCAALIGEDNPNEIFFAPPSLALHCLMAKESNKINNRYVHPDLNGMNAAAFTAAAMLYQVFADSPAFPAEDEIVRHEDMREGNFLPVRLAAPGLDDKLAALLQSALGQSVKRDGGLPDGTRLLGEFLALLWAVSPDSFVSRLSEADTLSIEKEKTQYLKTKTAEVNTRRFVKRNAAILIGSFAALVIVALIVKSIIDSNSSLTTANMEPVQVIESYYNAFGKLDHQWMDACVINGAGKDDVNMVIGLYVVNKLRQTYGQNTQSSVISAKDWLEMGGGRVQFQVFGVTGLQLTINNEQLTMNTSNEVLYRADYTLWVPGEAGGSSEMRQDAGDEPETEQNAMTDETAEFLPPKAFHRTDFVTLVQRRGNWRISEIKRVSVD